MATKKKEKNGINKELVVIFISPFLIHLSPPKRHGLTRATATNGVLTTVSNENCATPWARAVKPKVNMFDDCTVNSNILLALAEHGHVKNVAQYSHPRRKGKQKYEANTANPNGYPKIRAHFTDRNGEVNNGTNCPPAAIIQH